MRKAKPGKTLPIGMAMDVGRFGERVRFAHPLTGKRKSVSKKLQGDLPALASTLNAECMRQLVDQLGADAYPNGQINPDFLHTRIDIASEAKPIPPAIELVYFLLRGNDVVYVGKTDSLEVRLRKHVSTRKIFDRYYAFQPILPAEIVETYYILKFEPPYNVHRTGLKPATRKKLAKKRGERVGRTGELE